jgi:hypothetical protein
MGKTTLLLVALLSGFLSCRMPEWPVSFNDIPRFKAPRAVTSTGLVTAVYLPGSCGSPSVDELDAWYREAAWVTDLPARGVLVFVGKQPAPDTEIRFRNDSLPGQIFVLSGNGGEYRWKRLMGRSLFLSSVNPFARVFVPRWLLAGCSFWTAGYDATGKDLLSGVDGSRVVFENHRFRLEPGKGALDEEALLSAGFFRYLTERYGEYRFYQYLNGAVLNPGASEGSLFIRMFGIDFTTALAHYCDYLDRGGRL